MVKRRVFLIFFIVFTNLLGAGVVIPTLPLYAKGHFGANAVDAGYFTGLFYVAQLLAAPWLGRLSDRIGRRPVLVGSQLGTVASFMLFIFAGPIGRWLTGNHLTFGMSVGLVILYLARALDGITGGNITTAQAYLTDITHDEAERTQALGYVRAAFGLGLVFGPVFGALLLNISLLAPFIGAAGLTSLSVIMTLLMLEESLPAGERSQSKPPPRAHQAWRSLIAIPSVAMILTLAFVVSVNIAAVSAIFPLYAEQVVYGGQLPLNTVARNVGYMLAALGLTVAVSQLLLLRPLLLRFSQPDLILAAMICAAGSAIGLSALTGPRLVTLILLPAAVGYALGVPCGEALLVRASQGTRSGQVLGLFQAVNSSAYMVGPIIGGYLFEHIHPRAPFMLSSVITLGAIGLALALKQRLQLETQPLRS